MLGFDSNTINSPALNITLQGDRLQIVHSTQPQTKIERSASVLTEIKTAADSKEDKIHAVRYNPWNLVQRIRMWCKRAIVVDNFGTKLLVSVDSLKRVIGATDFEIQQLKRDGQLVEFLTTKLALTNLIPESGNEDRAINHPTHKIEHITQHEVLGKGGFAKVIRFINATGIPYALKYARKKVGKIGVQDVQKEYAVHGRIFGNKPKGIWGFQRQIIDRIAITLNKKNPQPGEPPTKTVMANRSPIYFGGEYFDEISKEDANREFTHLLPDFQQMMYTLHYMEQNGMSHNDIKPENMLVDQIDGVRVVHLCDLSGMAFERDGDPGDEVSGTPTYTPKEDLSRLQNPMLNAEKKHEIKGKRDVFAMGTAMYMALAGRYPFTFDKDNLPEQESYRPINGIRPGAIPPEFDSLLERMLQHNPDDRIGRTQAWNEFNQILAKYPEVQTRIAANMQTLGFDATAIA